MRLQVCWQVRRRSASKPNRRGAARARAHAGGFWEGECERESMCVCMCMCVYSDGNWRRGQVAGVRKCECTCSEGGPTSASVYVYMYAYAYECVCACERMHVHEHMGVGVRRWQSALGLGHGGRWRGRRWRTLHLPSGWESSPQEVPREGGWPYKGRRGSANMMVVGATWISMSASYTHPTLALTGMVLTA